MDITQSPGLAAPETIRAVVVYDAQTGVIVHRHLAVHYPGAPATSEAELGARALEFASARGIAAKDLRILHVDPQKFSEPVEHRVDVAQQALVTARVPLTMAEVQRRSRQSSR